MPDVERYEILVIGSGEAGKHLTWNMAQAGHREYLLKAQIARRSMRNQNRVMVLCSARENRGDECDANAAALIAE